MTGTRRKGGAWRGGLALLLALVVWLGAVPARAVGPLTLSPGEGRHGLAPHLVYLADDYGLFSFPQASSIDLHDRFRPLPDGDSPNLGYAHRVVWLRLPVRATAASDWLLEVGYPSLDRVELFIPGAQGYTRLEAGDLAPFAARPYPHRNLVFPLPLPAGESTLYLRVQSEGNLTLPLTLWTPEAFHRANPGLYAILALYYGSFLALGLYNLLLFFSLRDRVYLEYVLFVTAMAIGQASLNGFGNQFLWPGWPAWGNLALPVGFALTGLFGALFTRSFLATRASVPRLDRLLLFFVAWFLVALAAGLVSYRWLAMLTSLGGIGFSIVAWIAGLACLRRGSRGARFFLLAWSIMLVGVAVMAARNFGWLPTNFLTTYAMQIGSALEMLLLSFALADRIHGMRRDKEQAQVEALAARQALVDSLRHSEQALESAVAERTRELEDANTRLRDSREQLARQARLDFLTGLLNRAALDEELLRACKRAERRGWPVAVMLIDLDGFKPINDVHGHAVGDQVLRRVAERLRSAVRGSDTVGRLGGDEFVVLLEEAGEPEAGRVAEKLLHSLSAPLPGHGLELHLGASVGIAFYPQDGVKPKDLLVHADQAMYRAKAAGGMRYALAAEPGVMDVGATE